MDVNNQDITGTVRLTGGGRILLDSNGIASEIRRFGGGSAELILDGQTVEGRGNIGDNTVEITILPGSAIIGDQMFSSQRLKLDPSPAGLTNQGVMRSVDPSHVLELSGAGGGTFNNNGGVIETVGNGRIVELTDNAIVFGGVLCETGAGGLVRIPNNESATLQDIDVEIRSGATLNLAGDLENDQRITVDAATDDASLNVANGTIVRRPGGEIRLLSNAGTAAIDGVGNFTNLGNRISGSGLIHPTTQMSSQAKVSPGASSPASLIDTLQFTSDLNFADSRFELDLTSATGNAGTDWDQILVGGNLNLIGTNTIDLSTVDSSGVATALPDFNQNLDYSFPIVVANSISGFAHNQFVMETTDFINAFTGSFSVELVSGPGGDMLVVQYTGAGGVILGDVNQDGITNLLDVGPFIDVISSGSYQVEADINGDGSVNLLDIDGFINILNGG